MRIFKDPLEMIKEVERDLFEMGVKVQPATMQDKQVADDVQYETIEVTGYGYTVTGFPGGELVEMLGYCSKDKRAARKYAEVEFADRIASDYRNPGRSWREREEVWKQFMRDDTFAYSYNERIRTQLPVLIDELEKRPTSRQGVITIYDACRDMGNWGGKDRVPCSMYYQFYLRGGCVNLIYTMRSCDFLTHFPFDVFLAIELLKHVSESLGLESGVFIHFIGSLHAYRKDMDVRGIF